MDDDVLIRAITIGASIFITLATVTAVMMYYNTARLSVVSIGTGTNIEQNYREDIKNILYSTEATGSDVKNILQYFYGNSEVNICIDRYYAYFNSGAQITWIPLGDRERINLNKNVTYTQIMKTMMPNQKFRITNSGDKYIFDLIS
ncbi:MAG: hypothetical protein K0R72_493 [Clostridia bacterium]|jgi:hypothetical protein|nr:hypothetical protein [Clostridia bacterium]